MRRWRLALVVLGSSLALLSADAAIGQDKPKTATISAPSTSTALKASNFARAAAAKKPQTEAEWIALANQTLGGSNTMGSIFEALLAYMKDIAKESRDAAKIADSATSLTLESKASAFASSSKVDERQRQIRETTEKIEAERQAAAWQFGAATAAAAITAAAGVGGAATAGAAGGTPSNVQRIDRAGALTAAKGATTTPSITTLDGGAPTTTSSGGPTSPLGKVAFADAVLGGKLPAAARDEIRARRGDFLDAIVKSWETKTSLLMAIRSRAAQNAILGKERFAFVLPGAVYEAYEEAFTALVKSPKDKTAAFRARVALETLRLVSENL